MEISHKLILLLKRLEFSKNKKLPRAELESKQLEKFRRLISYAQERSPYYAKIIKDRAINTTTCRPADFPIITKEEVMINFDEIVTDRRITRQGVSDFLKTSKNPAELFLHEFYALHTSGSSGEVGVFVFSKSDWARGFAQVGRNNPLPSLFKPQRYACFFAADGHFAGASWATTLKTISPRSAKNVLIMDINRPISEVIDELNAFQPDVLGGYPSGTKILAEKQNSGKLKIKPKRIILSGEVLTEKEKDFIETAFNAQVANSYNCTEHMSMGASITGHPDISLWEDDLIFELQSDHFMVTNLFNYTLPLIRYKMTDTLIESSPRKSTGPYKEISGVIGRRENSPIFRNEAGAEDFISPHIINEIFVHGVRRFQLQIISRDSFRFAICLDRGIGPALRDPILHALNNQLSLILKQKKMANVKFTIEIVSDLPSDSATGKFKLIVKQAELSRH